MILSAGLQRSVKELIPEKQVLTTEEAHELHVSAHEGMVVYSDYRFSEEEKCIRYNYAAEGENRRWETIIKLPLFVVWQLQSIDGQEAVFSGKVHHSGKNADYEPRQFWMRRLNDAMGKRLVTLLLPETTVEIPHPTWLADKLNEPALFLASEAADYVARYRKVLESLPVLV